MLSDTKNFEVSFPLLCISESINFILVVIKVKFIREVLLDLKKIKGDVSHTVARGHKSSPLVTNVHRGGEH